MRNETTYRDAEKSLWKRWVHVLLFGSAAVLMLYLFVYEFSLYIYKQNHPWRFDIGRGIFWYYYFWQFVLTVVLTNFIYLIIGKGKLKTRLIINTVGWLLLFGWSARSIKLIPYAVMLTDSISFCLLIILPVLFKIAFDFYRPRDKMLKDITAGKEN